MTPYHGRESRDGSREAGRNEPHQVAGAAKGISLRLEFRIARGDRGKQRQRLTGAGFRAHRDSYCDPGRLGWLVLPRPGHRHHRAPEQQFVDLLFGHWHGRTVPARLTTAPESGWQYRPHSVVGNLMAAARRAADRRSLRADRPVGAADGKLWVCQIVGRTTRKSVSGAISIGPMAAPEGSVGYIVEVYDDAYEVEVTEPETGETLFLGAVPDADLDLISGHGPVS